MQKHDSGYYIGMDAGGTGTSVLISDGKDALCRARTEGLNCNSFPRERIEASLSDMKNRLEEKGFAANDCIAIGIGAAGNNNPHADTILRNALAKCGYDCPVNICSDADAALYGALEDADGILLIAGTGSICLGQANFGQAKYRAGGFGHLIDDEGSAYALGRDILSAVVKAEDGRITTTLLRDSLFRHLGITNSSELVGYVYDTGHTKKEIAQLAPLISLPENQGDQAVTQIISKAVTGLLEMTVAVYQRIESHCPQAQIPLIMHGSVLRNNSRIADALALALSRKYPRIRITAAKADAAQGALGLARKKHRAK